MERHITITRKTEGQDLYAQLQEKALKDVQRLAGEVWTDYNLHDPGVTLLDALNYVLLESDYRLQFPLPDYLTRAGQEFSPSCHGLFAPSQVFPVNPVTETDYRTLFISNIEGLSDVRVDIHPESGCYDFVLDVWPDTPDDRRRRIAWQVCKLFHAHRNLCENIGAVRFLEYDVLDLCAEIEIDETADVDHLTARVFFEVQEFLRAGVRFRRVDELLAEGRTPDEILEGPEQGRMVVDGASLCTDWEEYDLSWLYQKLRALPGVCLVASLGFKEGEKVFRNSLKRKSTFQGYALAAPDSGAHDVAFTRRGKAVPFVAAEVVRRLYGLRTDLYGAQNRTTDKEVLDAAPAGAYRDMFAHAPVGNDLPDCYKEHLTGQFAEYLGLFDRLVCRSLGELQRMPAWMSFDAYGLSEKKEQWMDVLDGIYGEDSNPAFLRKYESAQERRARRLGFLKDIPRWGLERGRAMNLQDARQADEAGVVTYLRRLLNFDKYDMEMFLVEHPLLEYKNGSFAVSAGEAFRISVVFTAASPWLYDDEFRQGCECLLATRMPAHLRTRVRWQDKERAGTFRSRWLFWKYSLSTTRKRGLEALCEMLKNSLADDNDWYC